MVRHAQEYCGIITVSVHLHVGTQKYPLLYHPAPGLMRHYQIQSSLMTIRRHLLIASRIPSFQ